MGEYAIEIILILSGVLVGVINTLAGGGAIITMTLFTVLGLPIGVANGTNRIAVILQNFTSSVAFIRKRMLDIKSGAKTNVINRYNSLQKELTAKYGRILKVNESDKNGAKTIYYFDGKYAVCLGIRWMIRNNKKIYYETQLEYHDVLLKEQPIINNDL